MACEKAQEPKPMWKGISQHEESVNTKRAVYPSSILSACIER